MLRLAVLLLLAAVIIPAKPGSLFGAGGESPPGTDAGLGELLTVVTAAASDIMTMCDRRPEVCEKSGEIAGSVKAKVGYWTGSAFPADGEGGLRHAADRPHPEGSRPHLQEAALRQTGEPRS